MEARAHFLAGAQADHPPQRLAVGRQQPLHRRRLARLRLAEQLLRLRLVGPHTPPPCASPQPGAAPQAGAPGAAGAPAQAPGAATPAGASLLKVKYAVVSSGYGPPGSTATDGDDFMETPTRTLTFGVKANGFTATSARAFAVRMARANCAAASSPCTGAG